MMSSVKEKTVNEAVVLYARGESNQSIADYLNTSGVQLANRKTKWKPQDVDSFVFGAASQFVSNEFLEVLKEVRKLRKRTIKFPSLLKGKLHCQLCGYGYVTQTVGYKNYRQRYYVCQTKSRKSEDCQSVRINADVLESRIIASILGLKKQKGLKKQNTERVHSEIFQLLKDANEDSPLAWRFTLAQMLIESVQVKTKRTANKTIPDIVVKTRIRID